MFRKDPFARAQWSSELVARCAATQTNILASAWDALASGGTLVYSTCTWEPSENEEQVQRLIERGAVPISVPIDPAWGFVSGEEDGAVGTRSYPHRVRGEGFFIAVLRKPGTSPERTDRSYGMAQGMDLGWTVGSDGFMFIEYREVVHAVGKQWAAVIETLMDLSLIHISEPTRPY